LDKITIVDKGNPRAAAPEFRRIDKSEPDWIYKLRKSAWEHFHASPLPLRSNHLWRYSQPENFMPVGELNRSSSKGLHLKNDMNELKNKGVSVGNLEDTQADNGELIKKYLGMAVGAEFGKFESLNMAVWNGGRFIYIPDNTVIEKPVHIEYKSEEQFDACRTLLIIGDNTEVSIIDDYSSNEGQKGGSTNSVTELFAGKSSRVKYLFLNRMDYAHRLYMTSRAVIDSNTNFEAFYAGYGAEISKINTGAILRGKGANSRMTGLIFSDGERRTDYHTRQHHKSGETYSNLDFRVVLKDKAKSAYTGLIRIEKDAANCEAYQENRNLLLNPGTKAESIPELEILTDQVQCSHGATMGPVDPEMIFYLKSRGIEESLAVRLIIEGFFESTMAKIPESFREIMTEELFKRLGADKS